MKVLRLVLNVHVDGTRRMSLAPAFDDDFLILRSKMT